MDFKIYAKSSKGGKEIMDLQSKGSYIVYKVIYYYFKINNDKLMVHTVISRATQNNIIHRSMTKY